MSKVFTITANTAIDNIIVVENFTINTVIKSKSSTTFPAGKGINVAKTLSTLGKKVTALGFVGEESHILYKQLNSSLLQMKLIGVRGETRTNISVLDSSKKTETHIQNPGFHVTKNDIENLQKAIENNVSQDDLVVISGSLPLGSPASAYKEIIRTCHRRQARVIFDSSDDHLKHGLKERPFMIKPNVEELESLTGKKLKSSEDSIINTAKEVLQEGTQLVVVSRGSQGVIMVEQKTNQTWKAYIKLNDPVISASQVGSGDAFVGGFTAGLFENDSLIEALKLGVACGAANLLSIGPGVSELEDIQRLLPQVIVKEIK